MPEITRQTPFVVSLMFSDGGGRQYHDLIWIQATDIATAAAAAASNYYLSGGDMPLYSVRVGCIDEDNARKAVAVYDFIREEKEREKEHKGRKVARLVPRVFEGDTNEPEPPAA